MILYIKNALLCCAAVFGLSIGYADQPFVVPKELMNAGALTFDIPTTKVLVLTEAELRDAEASKKIANLINATIQSNTLIKFPAGKYDIPAVIFVSGVSNVILEGAVDSSGAPATTLNFVNSLTNLYGNDTKKYGSFGAWHGGGGFINIGTNHPLYSNGPNKPASFVALKNFKITFNRTVYHKSIEDGYNAVFFSKASNSYAENIVINNYDNGFILFSSTHTTVKDAVLDAVRNGHFGIVINAGSYNLVENLITLSGNSHPLSIQKTSYNVFKNCTTARGAGDGISYRGGCHTNLFWNINSGESVLGASNGQNSQLATTYGKEEYYWNTVSHGTAFSASRVPSFLAGYVHAYFGPDESPFN